jgi:AraC-like DNA-binding protein
MALRDHIKEVSMPVGAGRLWQVPSLNNLELFRARSINYTYARHMHETFCIGVIEAGVAGNSYKGAIHLAPPGSIVFLNPGDVHTGFSASRVPLSYRMLYVHPDSMNRLVSDVTAKRGLHFSEPVIHNSPLARQLRDFHSTTELVEITLEVEVLFEETILAIISAHGNVHTPSQKRAKEHRAINQIKMYLQENYSENITLEQLATLSDLNRSYLIRVFRDEVGLPPYAYLTQVRVERAKRLLIEGHPLSQVAVAVGFADQSHLTRFFKRIVGVTPGRYSESQHHSRHAKSIR